MIKDSFEPENDTCHVKGFTLGLLLAGCGAAAAGNGSFPGGAAPGGMLPRRSYHSGRLRAGAGRTDPNRCPGGGSGLQTGTGIEVGAGLCAGPTNPVRKGYMYAYCSESGHLDPGPPHRAAEYPPCGRTGQGAFGPEKCRARGGFGLLGCHRHGRGQAESARQALRYAHQAGGRRCGPV